MSCTWKVFPALLLSEILPGLLRTDAVTGFRISFPNAHINFNIDYADISIQNRKDDRQQTKKLHADIFVCMELSALPYPAVF